MQTTAVAIKDCLTLHFIKLQSVLFDNWDGRETQAQLIFTTFGALLALSPVTTCPSPTKPGALGEWLTGLKFRLKQQDDTRLQAT